VSPEATAGKGGCFGGDGEIKLGHDSAAKMWTLNQNIQVAKGNGHCKADPSDLKEAEFISSVTAGRDATIIVNADGTKDRTAIREKLKMINKQHEMSSDATAVKSVVAGTDMAVGTVCIDQGPTRQIYHTPEGTSYASAAESDNQMESSVVRI
jgi:hypothetical protein